MCVCVSETRAHGAGGPSDHRHAVHPGARQESEGGSTRMLPPVLRQNQGVCVCVCVCGEIHQQCVSSQVTFIYIALLTIQIVSKQLHNIKIGI